MRLEIETASNGWILRDTTEQDFECTTPNPVVIEESFDVGKLGEAIAVKHMLCEVMEMLGIINSRKDIHVCISIVDGDGKEIEQ